MEGKFLRLDKKSRVRQLNRIAKKYDQVALVQKKMAFQLMQNLSVQASVSIRVIELGCGTGYLTQLLVHRLQPRKLIAVDIAAQMIEQAQKRVQTEHEINWLVADMEAWDWAGQLDSVDLVVSNAVVHWAQDPKRVLAKSHQALRLGGQCIHTMPGPDTFQELRFLLHQVEEDMGLPLSRHHFPLRSADEWEEMYEAAGFTDVQIEEYWHRVEYEDCHAFLQAMKWMGGNCHMADGRITSSQRALREVMHKYNLAYRSKKGVYATFHLIQCTARKG